MIAAIYFILGTIFGSFAAALAWRIHAGEDWLKGRSRCENCGHQLAALDLIPLVSWLLLGRRCRYCQSRLSWLYPLAEIAGGLSFVLSYLFWPDSFSQPGQAVLFVSWLVVCTGLISLAIYDGKWMMLPNKIIHPLLAVAIAGRLGFIAYQSGRGHYFALWLGSLAVASGLFWLIFITSRGRWIGFGDVRLGLITGTMLGGPTKSALMIFIASLLGTLAAVLLAFVGKKTLRTKIAYGPFLAIGAFFVMLFGQSVIDWYNRLFLG